MSYLDDPEMLAKSDLWYRVTGGTVYARALHHIAQNRLNYATRPWMEPGRGIRMLETKKGNRAVFYVGRGQRENWVPGHEDENAPDWQLGTLLIEIDDTDVKLYGDPR